MSVSRLLPHALSFSAGAACLYFYLRPPSLPSLPSSRALLASVELGGTTCRLSISSLSAPTLILAEHEIPTTTPTDTLASLARLLNQHLPVAAIGIASFGPVDLNQASETFGFITTTVKPHWKYTDVIKPFKELGVPLVIDTDVNAPALAEMEWGERGVSNLVYVTVGTGVGVGVVVDGKPVHGLMHPEAGHMLVARMEGDTYKGACDVHGGGCVEGMVSAKACAERIGCKPEELGLVGDDQECWERVSYYLAVMCVNLVYTASPEVIVLSGGVMKRKILFAKIRTWFKRLNNGYVGIQKNLDEFIVESKFGNDAGMVGGLELARRAKLGL